MQGNIPGIFREMFRGVLDDEVGGEDDEVGEDDDDGEGDEDG